MKERGNRLYKNLDKFIGIPLTVPFGFARKISRPFFTGNAKKPRIGILCLGAIGDLLMASGLINGIRNRLPEAELELVTSRANAAAAPLISGLDAIRSFNIADITNSIPYIRSRKFEILFDTTQWARIGNIICNLSSARRTIGFQTKGQYRSFGYDISVPHSDKIHETENFINLGKAIWQDFEGNPHLKAPVELLWPPRGENIYLHMWCMSGSNRRFRQWPEASWAALAEYLSAEGYTVNFTGSKSNWRETEDFLQKYHLSSEKIKNLAGNVTLSELACLFTKSRGVVSVNTGTMHMASLLGAKVIDLNGPTNVNRTGAYGKNSLCLTPDKGKRGYLNLGFEYPPDAEEVMGYISVEQVLAGMRKLGIIS